MSEKSDALRQIRKPDRRTLGSSRKNRSSCIEKLKKPAYATGLYLLSALFFLGVHVVKAEGMYKDTGKEFPGPEEVERFWRAYFPFGALSSGPIGCAIESMEIICRADKNPVTSFSYEVITFTGYGTKITTIQQDGACVRVFYKLSVDHGGPEGRICLSPEANLRVKLKLTTQVHSISPR